MTLDDTRDYLRALRSLDEAEVSAANRLRAAATLLDAGKVDIAEAIAGRVVDGLRKVRLSRNRREKRAADDAYFRTGTRYPGQ